MSQLKSAEEILERYETYVSHSGNPIFLKENAIAAMEEYADQFRLSPVSTDWGKLESELIKDAGTETLHKVDGFKVFHWIKQHLVSSVRQDSNVPCVAQVDSSNSIEHITPELYEALDALCDMWGQYCDGEAGHMFMSAGENAADILDKYKLLKNDKGTGGEVDYDQLEKLKALLTSPASIVEKHLFEITYYSSYGAGTHFQYSTIAKTKREALEKFWDGKNKESFQIYDVAIKESFQAIEQGSEDDNQKAILPTH